MEVARLKARSEGKAKASTEMRSEMLSVDGGGGGNTGCGQRKGCHCHVLPSDIIHGFFEGTRPAKCALYHGTGPVSACP